ncbi:ATPase assembly factor ATP10 protein [Raphanus sativus]|nr:ATPase assembly factor ATP10 protein [Raphanus sativus]
MMEKKTHPGSEATRKLTEQRKQERDIESQWQHATIESIIQISLASNQQYQGLFKFSRHESLPWQIPALGSTTRSFLDFYKFEKKKAIEDERARLNVEMNRGYFADMKVFKEHGGKEMISSWSKPFLQSFGDRKDLQLFEIDA